MEIDDNLPYLYNVHIYLFIIAIFWLPINEKSSENTWHLVNEEEGIEVYTRLTEGSPIKEVKVNMEIQSTLKDFLTVLNDVDKYTTWVYKCISAEKVEAVSDSEFYYYTESDFPFPISNRDMVVHSTQVISPDGNSVKSKSVAASHKKPEEKGIVRIKEFEASWDIRQIGTDQLKIEYQASTDPGGYLPAWVINLGIASAPLHTMQRLKKYVASQR